MTLRDKQQITMSDNETQQQPCWILRSLSNIVRSRFAKLPVKRSEVIDALSPIYGSRGARLYFSALRHGYIHEGYWMSGKHPCYSMGLRDGSELKRDSSCWPRILQVHRQRAANKPNKASHRMPDKPHNRKTNHCSTAGPRWT